MASPQNVIAGIWCGKCAALARIAAACHHPISSPRIPAFAPPFQLPTPTTAQRATPFDDESRQPHPRAVDQARIDDMFEAMRAMKARHGIFCPPAPLTFLKKKDLPKLMKALNPKPVPAPVPAPAPLAPANDSDDMDPNLPYVGKHLNIESIAKKYVEYLQTHPPKLTPAPVEAPLPPPRNPEQVAQDRA